CEKLQAGDKALAKMPPGAAIDSLLADRKKTEEMAAASKEQGTVLKNLAERAGVKSPKPTPEEIQKAIDGLTKAKQDADDRLAAAKEESAKATKEATDAKSAMTQKVADQEKAMASVSAARDSLNRTLAEGTKKLEKAKLLPPKSTNSDFLKGLDRAIE